MSTTCPGQSESASNEGVFHTPQTPRLEPQFNVAPRILDVFKYCYQTLKTQFNIDHLFIQN